MRVVLDTVILVRGLINPFSLWGRLLFDFGDRYQWVVSAAIAAVYLVVVNRPELVGKYRTVATRDSTAIFEQLATAIVVEPPDTPAICRDPADDKFLAAATTGNALFIVSEDRDLLDLGSYERDAIVTAKTLLGVLENKGTASDR